MNLKKVPLLALPLLGLSALGLGLFPGQDPLPSHSSHLPPLPEGPQVVTGTSVADTIRSDATPPRSPVGVLGAPVGSHFRYAFATARSLRMETEGGSPKHLSLRGEGKLGVAIAARRGEEILVEIRCRDLELTGSGPVPQGGAHLDDLAGRLRNCPVLIRMGNDGRHLALRFGEGADAEVQQWLRNLVSCLQLVVDEDATGEWDVEETDMGGAAWSATPVPRHRDLHLLAEDRRDLGSIDLGEAGDDGTSAASGNVPGVASPRRSRRRALATRSCSDIFRCRERDYRCRAVVRRNVNTLACEESSKSGRRSATRNASCARSSASAGDAPSTRR